MSKRVVCIDNGGHKYITVGKEYEIIDSTEKKFRMLNDNGDSFMYHKRLFKSTQPINRNVSLNLESVTSELQSKLEEVADNKDIHTTAKETKPTIPTIIYLKDLVGQVSADGRFTIMDANDTVVGYEVIGVKTNYPYFDFNGRDHINETIESLVELGFQFTIKERKSYIEMLDECEKVEFEARKLNHFVAMNVLEGRVCSLYDTQLFIPNVKYISKEDAERIEKECKENKK